MITTATEGATLNPQPPVSDETLDALAQFGVSADRIAAMKTTRDRIAATVAATPSRDLVYVGVDLDARKVVTLTRYQDTVAESAYVLVGRFDREDSQYGRVILSTDDDSPLGEKAREIALDPSQQGIGLGWNFTVQS